MASIHMNQCNFFNIFFFVLIIQKKEKDRREKREREREKEYRFLVHLSQTVKQTYKKHVLLFTYFEIIPKLK